MLFQDAIIPHASMSRTVYHALLKYEEGAILNLSLDDEVSAVVATRRGTLSKSGAT